MRKKSPINYAFSALLLTGSAIWAAASYKKKRKQLEKELENPNRKLHQIESADASKEQEEKELTQLDSVQRSEWVANGFPQTHQEMRELEEEEKK
ncbi:hypothetical protein [Metabacillus sp. 84]|uniref:hypothetical protein n=1 Tax=unclassified Metabacillus TaxID=2675274 RepID=UPI003CF522A9